MTIFQSIVLGLIQGVTEFLPVSSSGHLLLVREVFGWDTEGSLAFDAMIHLATLAAIFIALWPEVKNLTFGFLGKKGYKDWQKRSWMILVVAIPVLLAGFFLEEVIEVFLRQRFFVLFSLAAWGIMLFLADRYSQRTKTDICSHIGWKESFWIGLSQILAFIPGTSRSGITITVGRLLKLDRDTAARFSFLLGIPVIAAAGGFSLLQMIRGGSDIEWFTLFIGFFTALVSGIIAIRFLLRFVRTKGYGWFAFYRLALVFVFLFFL